MNEFSFVTGLRMYNLPVAEGLPPANGSHEDARHALDIRDEGIRKMYIEL